MASIVAAKCEWSGVAMSTGVDLVGHCVKHYAEIVKGAGVSVDLLGLLCVASFEVDIAQCDDVAVA
jgi:hypothetical protein